jgi:hemolysin activation/secretion protein
LNQSILLTTAVLCSLSLTSFAVPTLDQHEQQEQARRQQEQLQRQLQDKGAQLETGLTKAGDLVLPREPDGFLIRQITIDVTAEPCFKWLQEAVKPYAHHRYGVQGLDLLVKYLNSKIAERGFLTTTVMLPEQDLGSGHLLLKLVPGYIGHIRFANPKQYGTWHNAFPTYDGNLLNVRALEQGVEQMQHAGNQEVKLKLIPGEKAGTSDVILNIKRSKPWSIGIGFDDAGLESTGRREGSISFALYNPTGLNDTLSYTYNRDFQGHHEYGTKGYDAYYSLPLGNYTFDVSAYHNEYHERVKALTPYDLSSSSYTVETGLTGLIYRDRIRKTQGFFKLLQKKRNTYINGENLGVQHQETTAYRIGLLHRQYWGQAVLDGSLYYQKGMPWLGAEPGYDDFTSGYPTTRYALWGASLNIAMPVKLGKITGRYNFTARGQYTNDTLYGTEHFSIGGRYTVRGFDGEQTLAAENGFFLRNELGIPLTKLNMEPYLGIDYGRVWGPSSEYLLGNDLAGIVLGLRGTLASSFQYDLFIGAPLYKPEGFQTAKTALGFNVMCRF